MRRVRCVVAVAVLALGPAACSQPAPREPLESPAPTAGAPSRTPRPEPTRLVRAGPPVQVRVLQYNIQFARAGIDGVARDIRSSGADVVLLNEVDDRRATGGVSQAAYLARRLGMDVAYDPNGTVDRGRRGNAVLTSFDVVDVRRFDLPRPDGTEQRGLMRVVLTRGDLQVRVWTTHLDPDDGTRAQARRVRTRIGVPDCTTILGADLNVRPHRDPPRLLREHLDDLWLAVGTGEGGTNSGGRRRIDYLYSASAEPVSVEVRPRLHSDHRGLLGTFVLDPADNC